MAFLPMKMWLQQQAIKRKKWLQPGSNELKLYPFKSIAEIRINKDSKHIPQNKKTQQHSYWAYICINYSAVNGNNAIARARLIANVNLR